jgi:hypothetical protein
MLRQSACGFGKTVPGNTHRDEVCVEPSLGTGEPFDCQQESQAIVPCRGARGFELQQIVIPDDSSAPVVDQDGDMVKDRAAKGPVVDEGGVEDEPAAPADSLKRAPEIPSISVSPKENEGHFADGKAFLDSAPPPNYTPFSFEEVEFSDDVTTAEGTSPEPQEAETAGERDGTTVGSGGT